MTEAEAVTGSDSNAGILTSDPSGSESSNTDVLGDAAREQRDFATFARHGLNPDGTPLQEQAKEPVNAKDEPAAEAEDDDSDDEETTAVKSEDEEDDEEGLTDEQLDRYVEALLELNADKLAKNPRLRERIEQELRGQVEEDNAAKQRAATAVQERERLSRQGKEAVDAVFTLFKNASDGLGKAQTELDKAYRGEEFDPKALADALKIDSKSLEQHLGLFAQAAVGDLRRGYDDAFAGGFNAALKTAGPVTDEERKQIVNIVNTAQRIEGDEDQGAGRYDKAKDHLYVKTFEMVAKRSFEAGRQAAIAEVKTRRDAKKTLLDESAVLAAEARVAAGRAKAPPAPIKPGAQADPTAPTMEAYRAAKAAGDSDLADRILQKMQSSVPAESQRRLRR